MLVQIGKIRWQVCMNVLGSLPSFPYHATSSAGDAIESGLAIRRRSQILRLAIRLAFLLYCFSVLLALPFRIVKVASD